MADGRAALLGLRGRLRGPGRKLGDDSAALVDGDLSQDRRLFSFEFERAEARGLFDQINGQPLERQVLIVENNPRFHTWGFLELLLDKARGMGGVHVDATIMIERPHVSPVREQMRSVLAEALGLEVAHVNIKATRGEGMGFVGRAEGAAALAVATVEGP